MSTGKTPGFPTGAGDPKNGLAAWTKPGEAAWPNPEDCPKAAGCPNPPGDDAACPNPALAMTVRESICGLGAAILHACQERGQMCRGCWNPNRDLGQYKILF